MKTKRSRLETRGFLQMSARTLSLFASILILGSFTTSHAQAPKQSISTTIRFVCSTGSVASYDEFATVQIDIDGQPIQRGLESVPSGPRKLRVIPQPPPSEPRIWIVKEIKFEEKILPAPDPSNVPLTITYRGPGAAVPRLEITVDQCGAAATSQRYPVIFLPGVAGTGLYDNSAVARAVITKGQAKEVWPLAPQALSGITRYSLRLREDGETAATNSDILVGDILRRSSTLMEMDPSRAKMNFYGGMMEFIETKGYKEKPEQAGEKRSLIAFRYDWRKDNTKQLPALDAVISTALRENNAKKVILLAHSMGGVIARAYILSKPEWAAKVDSLITMGTPYWGTPKPYYGVVSGYHFGNPFVDKELMKILAQNFPAAYQLMPVYPFIEDAKTKQKLTVEESLSIRYKGISDVTPPKQIVSSYKETVDNVWSFNPGLVKLAQDFSRPSGTQANQIPLPGGVKHYAIIGVGVKTLAKFSMRDFIPPERFVELAGRQVVLEPIFEDGDGTVPREGADIFSATRYFIPYVKKTFLGLDASQSSEHSDLPANPTVQEIVGEIIAGKPPDASKYTYQEAKKQTTGLVDLEEKGANFTLHSDAHLSIADQSTGRKLGFNNQGGIDEDLPTGTFLSIEGVEYASIADIDRTLKVTVTGIQEGKFTLDVDINRGGNTVHFSYREVPVKQGTVAEVILTPGQLTSPPPPLTATTDGSTTTIPASSSAGGPLIPQGGTPQPTPVSPVSPSSGGIGGTWTAPTGDIIELIQNGNRITGRYRGILGTGEITGTFDGKNLSATVRPDQALLPLAIPLTLTLMEDGKLFGHLETPLMSGALVFSRTRR